MVPASRTMWGRDGRTRAFSLAEMMIALIILGFGLLVVAAALPVGMKYTQATVNQATGEAAAEYALDLIEQRIRLRRNVLNDGGAVQPTDLFRPRNPTDGTLQNDPAVPGRLWEPLIKVRPLLTRGIDPANPATDLDPFAADSAYRQVEQRIAQWTAAALGAEQPYIEHDAYGGILWTAPNLPSICAAYPPVSVTDQNGPLTAQAFFNAPYAPLEPQGMEQAPARRQAVDRTFCWTAFYRRVSYAEGSDPNLYEFIVVVTQRGPDTKGFPLPASATSGTTSGRPTGSAAGWSASPAERGSYTYLLAPAPVLVTSLPDEPGFVALPPLPPFEILPDGDRVINDPAWTDPPTLTFTANAKLGRLLPPGSLFIPAVNDDQPSVLNPTAPPPGTAPVRRSGFVPHAPETLPIYKVLDRKLLADGTTYELTVQNNGFYPWTFGTQPGQQANPQLWPVWVIPPAVTGTDSYGPVYDDANPIVTVKRRIVRLHEVP